MNKDELRILAHTFLTAKADEAQTAALRAELESRPASGLELLAQMQEALGTAPRSALSAAQVQAVEKQVEALIASRKPKGLFGLFKGPSSKSGKSAKAAPVDGPLVPESEMEDLAPISPLPEPIAERAQGPRPLAPSRAWRIAGLTLLLVLLALGLYTRFSACGAPDWTAWMPWMHHAKPGVAAAPARPLTPPRVFVQGPPVRADVVPPAQNAPLPAELPSTTPQELSGSN